MINTLAIAGYRSLRQIILPLERFNVITGPNGSGKSSIYRALRLLADVAQGRVISSLAAEGGLHSTLWAGPEKFSRGMKQRTEPVQGTVRMEAVSLRMGFSSDDYGYAIDLGLPVPSTSLFGHDPEIKVEAVWAGEFLRPSNVYAERHGAHSRIRNFDTNIWREAEVQLSPFDSMMTHNADMTDGLELLSIRERMRRWRFYDDIRTDRGAPARKPQIGTFTPVLASDGSDLSAALQTIYEIGDAEALDAAIDDAFDGSTLHISGDFQLQMRQPGLLRPLNGSELSDGTLRYLLLMAALLSPRPPDLMILNEPEASLHPDLIAPLARLLLKAAEHCQIVIVSHSIALVDALAEGTTCQIIRLEKDLGETMAPEIDLPPWTWPKR